MVENFSTILKDKYTKLDVLTTQKVLHEKFLGVRTKGQKTMDIIISEMMGGFLL